MSNANFLQNCVVSGHTDIVQKKKKEDKHYLANRRIRLKKIITKIFIVRTDGLLAVHNICGYVPDH